MVHHRKVLKQGIYAWRCGFCSQGFGDIYSRDQHEVHCPDRKGAKETSEGRRVGVAW
jgi:hypothetical protein